MVDLLYEIVKFLHVMTAVFMAAPLYNLIVVSERLRMGKAPIQVDQYFENIIRGNSKRCYVFQLSALATGLALVSLLGFSASMYLANWRLVGKTGTLLMLLALLTIVTFNIQPKIDRLLANVTGNGLPPDVASSLAPLRKLRRRLAAICLFLVIASVILAVQVFAPFSSVLTLGLMVLGALFSWRVYERAVPLGWI